MSSSFDISRFPNLPPEVLKAFEAQQAALEASRMETIIERAARLHQEAVVSEKEGHYSPSTYRKAALAFVGVGLDDLDTALVGIFADLGGLAVG